MLTKTKKTRFLAFLPAAIAVGLTVVVASGISLIPGATAASTVGVTGSVATSGSADPDISAGDCADDGTNESLALFNAGAVVTDGCEMTFYTNNALGASVMFSNDFGAEAAFFCNDLDTAAGVQVGTRSCATATNRVADVASNSAIGADSFGLALKRANGGGGNNEGSGVEAADATPTAAEAIWYPITGVAAQLCDTSSPNDGSTLATCGFAFGGQGKGGTQSAGDYYGRLRLVLQQN